MTSHAHAPPGGWTAADKVPTDERQTLAEMIREREARRPKAIDGVLTIGRTRWTVEKLPEDPDKTIQYAYKLTGVRGAEYLLMRNGPHPEMLFAINGRRFGGTTPFRDGWFSDGDKVGGVLTYLG